MSISFLKKAKCVYFILLVTSTIFYCGKLFSQTLENPVPKPFVDSSIYQADPTIFFYKGTYYLYGTNDKAPDNGIKVFTSANLKTWQTPKTFNNDGYALRKPESFGSAGFWAPQVWNYNRVFYMAYVANEQIAIAKSNAPLGPFSANSPLAFKQKNIDPFIFIDGNRKKYLFYVDISNGNRIFVAEMTDDFSAVKPETHTLCITATEPWETIKDNVIEGPTVIKHNGLYYLIYSANNFISPGYAVGYATSSNVNGPWQKYTGNPILSKKNTGQPGPGHGDIFFDKNNNMYYVFHTHNSNTSAIPRRTAIVKASFVKDGSGSPDKLVMDGSKFFFLKKINDF